MNYLVTATPDTGPMTRQARACSVRWQSAAGLRPMASASRATRFVKIGFLRLISWSAGARARFSVRPMLCCSKRQCRRVRARGLA